MSMRRGGRDKDKIETNEAKKAKLIISKDSDALLAILSKNKVVDTIELADNVLLDLDENEQVVSVEIMGIREAEVKEGKRLLIKDDKNNSSGL
ncbi:MAG: DUF2283 domain-containing protein [Methanophagales archaeon]|nr:DUF2283 domain-containing protein [Methanophagales archaeon]